MEGGIHTLHVEPDGKRIEIDVPAIEAGEKSPREVTLEID